MTSVPFSKRHSFITQCGYLHAETTEKQTAGRGICFSVVSER